MKPIDLEVIRGRNPADSDVADLIAEIERLQAKFAIVYNDARAAGLYNADGQLVTIRARMQPSMN